MAPFASMVFLIVCFYLVMGNFRQPDSGIVPLEQLPQSFWNCCHHYSDGHQAVISINLENHFSFAVNQEHKFQSSIINYVAAKHRITLTAKQLSVLEKLPFIASSIEELPMILDAPSWQLDKLIQKENSYSLPFAQLTEYIEATKTLTKRKEKTEYSWGRTYYALNIDGNVNASQVLRLTDLLQADGINSYYLLTQGKKPPILNRQ